ncbi:hypothetical protein [Faecalibaculum rodentium]|uniref:hypothetical protein n=1 Tax=Faecalibaculum rodentium TaxID=1702221 RepID=UPI002633E23E|nr:hypothetical protein [Faecalibaculum rodentium]
MTDTQVYGKLLQVRACADLRTMEMLKDLISEFESRERSKKAPSKSVAALVKAFPASWKRHIKRSARKALQYGRTMEYDGQTLQMVTDSYMLIGFQVQRLEDCPADIKYPPVERLIPTDAQLDSKPLTAYADDLKIAIAERKAMDKVKGIKTEIVPYKLEDDLTVDAQRLQKVLKWTGSKSVTLYRQTGSGSALKPLRGTTESGDLLVICPVRCAA